MKVVVFGSSGQLASSLKDQLPPGCEALFADRSTCDLGVPGAVTGLLESTQPSTIINAAAYTAVDQAESDAEAAFQVNAAAVREMADFAANTHGRLLHISTDFVFDGTGDSPYRPGDRPAPVGEYGRSKLAGEQAVLAQAANQSMIIRTSWVYSEHGANFVKTMLRLMAEREELGVVADQVGSPTYAGGLAEIIWHVLAGECFRPGIFHWSDAGAISWHDFAVAIQAEAEKLSLLARLIPIRAISTADYPTPAARPAYSVLDSRDLADLTGKPPVDWRDNLSLMLGRLVIANNS